jgi:HlyD family secretion protein
VKKLLKIGGIVVLVLGLVGAGILALQRQARSAQAQPATTTTTVTRGSIEETVSASGNVIARQEASLAFATSGEIAAVPVIEGQQIQAGEVLARLDTTSLERQVARSQASLDTARARLAQAQEPPTAEELASAQAALDSALAAYDKVLAGPSEAEIASAQAALDSARANYKKVKAGPSQEDLAAAQAQVDNARASLQQAQAAYDRIKDQPDAAMRQESLNLQSATISLQQAQANYDSAANHPTASELASAAAQVAQAEASLDALLERPTASELASAAAQVAQARSSLAALQARPKAADVAVFQAQVDEAALALAQAEDGLEDALLVAPFPGRVLQVNARQGEWASPGSPAVVLAATQQLALEINVDEVDVSRLAEGQDAYLKLDALKGHEIAGTVTYIAPSSSSVGGAVAYLVKIEFDPGDLPMRLGMTADVDMVVARADDALLVPNRAVEADRAAGRYYVTRQKAAGVTQRVEVRIGLRDGDYTQIVEGLEEGDRLVLPTVPTQNSSSSSAMPFGGAGQQMRQMGEGN